jgi:predicted GNAT family acetyltransferase
VLLPHTVVQPEFGGRGLGSILAAQALADLAERGDVVVPTCPFVTRYLGEHDVPGLRIEWPEGEAEGAEA